MRLARPESGANNACDPAAPYSDAADIHLEARPGATEGGPEAHVLVRTEEEQWLAVRA